MQAWHFLNDNWTTFYGNLPVKVGETLTHEGEIVPCESGLHASVRAIDALLYAQGNVITRVECEGDLVEHGGDKIVCRRRTVLWGYDCSEVLRSFGRRCALSVIDKWDCPPIVRRWLETGDESIRVEAESAADSAARSAARDAARSAARGAAESAAWSAARGAAESAARSAAWSAAWSAAGGAARGAAWSAAWDAARGAAHDLARDQQNTWLEEMLEAGVVRWALTPSSPVTTKDNMKIPFSMTQDSLTIFHNGPKTFLAGTIQYNSLKAAILQEQWNKVPDLLTTAGALSAFLGGSFSLDGDDIAFNGVKLPESIQRRIRVIADEGGDVGPLFRFYERLHKNPSFRSREQLHRFMEHNDIAIESDGTFLAYKGLKDDYTDCHTGTIDNSPGQKHVMDRNLVSDDPETPCHFGFHVGALGYASGFGPVVVICRVDPEHVVCVPKDYASQKMRTCQYEVVGEWSGQAMSPVADDSDLPGNYDHGGEDADEEYDVDLEDIDQEPWLGDPAAEVVPQHADLGSLGTKDLMKCSLDSLRKYASNVLLIHGASKIPGGKSALVSKIMSVRRRRARK